MHVYRGHKSDNRRRCRIIDAQKIYIGGWPHVRKAVELGVETEDANLLWQVAFHLRKCIIISSLLQKKDPGAVIQQSHGY